MALFSFTGLTHFQKNNQKNTRKINEKTCLMLKVSEFQNTHTKLHNNLTKKCDYFIRVSCFWKSDKRTKNKIGLAELRRFYFDQLLVSPDLPIVPTFFTFSIFQDWSAGYRFHKIFLLTGRPFLFNIFLGWSSSQLFNKVDLLTCRPVFLFKIYFQIGLPSLFLF